MSSVRRIAVEIPDPGKFETQVSRGQGTTPAAAIGGLLGAVIVESVNKSQDRDRADRIGMHLDDTDCRAPIKAAFQETLIASRRMHADISQQAYDDSDLGGYEALVRIEIESCGFRVLDRDRQVLSAFVDLTLRVKTRKTGGEGWSSRQSFAGNVRASLYDLESNAELVQSEFQQVLHSAGRRLAGELLYP